MEDFERKFAVNPGDEAAGRPKELEEARKKLEEAGQ